MKPFYFLLLGFLLITACPSGKKDDPGKTQGDQNQTTLVKPDNDNEEKPAELTELVYEGVGKSVLKIESNARSQAELKGRKELIRVLAEDARKMLVLFMREQPVWFSSVNAEQYAKEVEETMIASATLKGSRVSEYSQNGDTTFAVMEISLLDGYETIESTIVSVGLQKQHLNAEKKDDFRKTFKEFFLKEKKKLLTPPA